MSRTLSGLQSGEFDEVDIFHSLTINGDGGQENYVVASNGDNTIDWKAVGTLIPNNSITNQQIAANTITKDQIANNTITNQQIETDTITASEIAPNTIGASEIKPNIITASEIAPNTITASELADDSVTSNELALNAVKSVHILNGEVNSNNLANDAVSTIKIVDGAVTSDKIVDDAVTTDKIVNGAVTAAKIGYGVIPTIPTLHTLTVQTSASGSLGTYDTTADTTVSLPAPPALSSVTFTGGTNHTPITYDPTDSAATTINIPNMLTPQVFVGRTNITSLTTSHGTGSAFQYQVATNLNISSDVLTNGKDIDLAAPSGYPPPDDGKIKNGTIENCGVNTQGNPITTINSTTGATGVISCGTIYSNGDLIGGLAAGGGAGRVLNMYGITVSTTGASTFPKATAPGYGSVYTEPNVATGTMYVDEHGFVKIKGYTA